MNSINGRHLAVAIILSVFVTVSTAQNRIALPELDRYISRVLQTFAVPGAAVAIVKDGKLVMAKGYGTKKLGTNDPVDANTLFLIASNSKAFTATALAILVEEGKLTWEDKVTDYLPWFKMSDEYVTAHLSVRDLLVHHSGLPAYAGDIMLFPPSAFSRREILMKLRDIPLKYDFRTTYAYDNILYLAAGEVVAAVSGMSWEDFVKKRIFDPAGMKQSISRYSLLKTSTNFSFGHSRNGNEVRIVENFRDRDIGDAGNPAGGICSNAVDMASWLITQLDSGVTPLKTKIFQPATTAQLWKIVTPIPLTRFPEALKPAQADFWGYALGFRTYNYRQYQVIGHGGALHGFVSQIAMVPALKLGIVVLTNQQSSGAYWSIINHVLDHYMQNPAFDWLAGYKKMQDSALLKSAARRNMEEIKKDSPVTAALPLEKYTGTYSETLLGKVTIEKESSGLVMRFANSAYYTADLEYFQYNNFLVKFRGEESGSKAYLSFEFNPDGSVGEARIKAPEDFDLDFDGTVLKPFDEKITDSAVLRKSILLEFDRHPEGVFAVAVKDLSSGRQFFINERETFHAASTMKTPVMIEAYKQAAAGKFSITDSIVIRNEFKSIADSSSYSLDSVNDSEHGLYLYEGRKLPVYDVLHRMITQSSNLATNIIINLVGAGNVNETMRQLGARDIQVRRGVEDSKAFEKRMNNTVTAYDLMLIMENIAEGKAVNKASSDAMIKILLDQQFTEKIARKLPPGVKVASKSGSITAVSHDSGIVFLPDGRKYVVVLLSRGVENENDVDNTLAGVSKLIYNYIK